VTSLNSNVPPLKRGGTPQKLFTAGQDVEQLEDSPASPWKSSGPLSVKDAALVFAAAGWPVFPCNLDKSPRVAGGFKAATTNREQIETWWRWWPDALIGVRLGAANGVFVTDLDRKPNQPDGVATWAELIERNGAPATLMAQTPSTGRHLFFRWPDGLRNIPLNGLYPGIEIKAEGGYVCVHPSRNGGWAVPMAQRFGNCRPAAMATGPDQTVLHPIGT